ncbi:hypothetical protein PR048_016096 [Dryococelus australis]|uniref:Uncharacterized protein n=1 Tax=Dryococelus australis TaxID=614101 RepID=A0ABQ9HIT8_9NEOP|nr:hypothetical protein PR048_016096 [Dryococelus australis]
MIECNIDVINIEFQVDTGAFFFISIICIHLEGALGTLLGCNTVLANKMHYLYLYIVEGNFTNILGL